MASIQAIQFVGDNVFINIEYLMEDVDKQQELYQNISELILDFMAREFHIKIIGITIPLEQIHAEKLFEFLHIFEPIGRLLICLTRILSLEILMSAPTIRSYYEQNL